MHLQGAEEDGKCAADVVPREREFLDLGAVRFSKGAINH